MVRFDEGTAARVLGEIHEHEVVAFLQRLIQCETVNPPGDVREGVAVCADKLEHAGFETRTVHLVEEKPNLIAEFGPGDGPTLCFNAHLDVVPPGDLSAWAYPPFGGVVANGRVYGRGAGDDKASVTAQVMAGVALARSGVPIRGRLVVNEVADEEIGGPNGAEMVVHGRHIVPDFVIVGEQTLNRVCVGEKGFASTRIRTRGKTAHGALPWEGANALEAMAEIIVAIRRELPERLAQRTHPYFQPSSMSVNMIEAGVKENVVPDVCELYIDRRIVPGEDPMACLAEIREIAERAVAAVPGVEVEVYTNTEMRAATMNPPDAAHVVAMVEANRYLGLNTDLTGFSMGTDGRFFADLGYPTIIYGPGDPRIAHIADEWVGIDEVMEATRAYALTALELLGV
jgi:succinyl-diaminopimelate desuccinylase